MYPPPPHCLTLSLSCTKHHKSPSASSYCFHRKIETHKVKQVSGGCLNLTLSIQHVEALRSHDLKCWTWKAFGDEFDFNRQSHVAETSGDESKSLQTQSISVQLKSPRMWDGLRFTEPTTNLPPVCYGARHAPSWHLTKMCRVRERSTWNDSALLFLRWEHSGGSSVNSSGCLKRKSEN